MNPFKTRRREFIRRFFPFPTALELAIRASRPIVFSTHLLGQNPLDRLHRCNRPGDLYHILDLQGFSQHFNWSFACGEGLEIADWCCLFWSRSTGLLVHFEMMGIYRPDEPESDPELDEASRQLFHSRRKTILSRFLGGRLIAHAREEDFCCILVDRRNPDDS